MHSFFIDPKFDVDGTKAPGDEHLRAIFRSAAGIRARIPEDATGTTWLLAVDAPSDFAAGLLALWDNRCTALLSADTQPGTLEELQGKVDGVISDNPSLKINGPLITFPVDAPPSPLATGEYDPDGTAIQLFTSGSTGTRKIVSKSFRQLFEEVRTLEALWGSGADAVPRFTTVSHQHIYGFLFNILWPLFKGRPLPRTRSLYWEEILCEARDVGAIIVSSPPHLRFLADIAGSRPFNWGVSQIFSSGGPLGENVAGQIETVTGICPIEVYGSTETGGVGFRSQRRGGDSLFTAMPGVHLRTGSDGQLEITSPWQGDSAWVATGDKAKVDADERFFLLGRVDTIVKVAGKRVSLTEMMTLINTVAAVSESRVFALSEHGGSARSALAAVIRVSAEQAERLNMNPALRRSIIHDIRKTLETRFDSSVLPRKWRFVDEWPVDERGKISATSLQKLVENE